MSLKVLFCFIVCCTFAVSSNVVPCPYAKFGANHSGCKVANPTCDPKLRNVTAYDIHVILSTHNQLRQKVAVGNQSGQPHAADMKVVKWDSELAFLAQKLADQCRNERDCADCRQVDRFPVGQQFRISKRSSSAALTESSFAPDWEESISAWYKTVSFFNSGFIRSYSFSVSFGTYSQLVWANTSYVGCGYTSFMVGKMVEKIYVCNYGPAGNIIEDEMYKIGPACESCPENYKCSKQYPGLCAENESETHLSRPATSDEVVPLDGSNARDKAETEPQNPTTANDDARGKTHTEAENPTTRIATADEATSPTTDNARDKTETETHTTSSFDEATVSTTDHVHAKTESETTTARAIFTETSATTV